MNVARSGQISTLMSQVCGLGRRPGDLLLFGILASSVFCGWCHEPSSFVGYTLSAVSLYAVTVTAASTLRLVAKFTIFGMPGLARNRIVGRGEAFR
jgi:hypothetical protein